MLEVLGIIILAPIAATVVLSVTGGFLNVLFAPSDAEIARRRKAEDKAIQERRAKQEEECRQLAEARRAEREQRIVDMEKWAEERDRKYRAEQAAKVQAYRDKYR